MDTPSNSSTKFVISRPQWLRGTTTLVSQLRHAYSKKMCCLGQIALQCGAKPDDITGRGTLDAIPKCALAEMNLPEPLRPLAQEPGQKCVPERPLARAMMNVNDALNISDTVREQRLIELCAPHNITLEFTDEKIYD